MQRAKATKTALWAQGQTETNAYLLLQEAHQKFRAAEPSTVEYKFYGAIVTEILSPMKGGSSLGGNQKGEEEEGREKEKKKREVRWPKDWEVEG